MGIQTRDDTCIATTTTSSSSGALSPALNPDQHWPFLTTTKTCAICILLSHLSDAIGSLTLKTVRYCTEG